MIYDSLKVINEAEFAGTSTFAELDATTASVGGLPLNNVEKGGVLSAELDLTTLNDTITVIPANTYTATERIVVTKITAYISEVLAMDTATPVVTCLDEDNVSTGLTITDFADGDAVDDVRLKAQATGDSTIEISYDKALQVEVTTAGTDAGTATGKCKVFVEYIVKS